MDQIRRQRFAMPAGSLISLLVFIWVAPASAARIVYGSQQLYVGATHYIDVDGPIAVENYEEGVNIPAAFAEDADVTTSTTHPENPSVVEHGIRTLHSDGAFSVMASVENEGPQSFAIVGHTVVTQTFQVDEALDILLTAEVSHTGYRSLFWANGSACHPVRRTIGRRRHLRGKSQRMGEREPAEHGRRDHGQNDVG